MAAYKLRVGWSGPPLPAWREAMTVQDKVYEIGEAPTALAAKVTWPSAGSGNYLMNNGIDSNPWKLHLTYGGSIYVPEHGEYGAIVFCSTGEGVISNQMTVFEQSSGAPTWEMFQQPNYATSEAEAITMGADWYYSEADYAALDSAVKIDIVGEATFASTWTGTFPVGYRNWVARRKYNTSLTGNSRPWFFRYEMPVYIPPAMTGTANGAIVVNSEGTIYGPFSSGPIPTGCAEVDWFADMWGGSPNRRKHYLYAMNVQTGTWTRLSTPIPEYTRGNDVVNLPVACVDETAKRIYYWTISGTDNALFYADFTNGLAGVTISTPAAMTQVDGGTQPNLAGNSLLCAVQIGVNAGKKLWFLKDNDITSGLLLIDIAANSIRRLTIAGLPARSHQWGMGYDETTNTVHITTKHTSNGMRNFRFALPDTYTSAANYTVTETVLDTSGLTLDDLDALPIQSGQRHRFDSYLGTMMATQNTGKMLAYVPS